MKFPVIVADPPWLYNQRCTWSEQKGGPTKFGGGASDAYLLMSDQDILDMKDLIQKVAAKDAILLMWVTSPRLDFGMEVLKHWGFDYVTKAFCWEKITKAGEPATGPGFYTASNTEDVLCGALPSETHTDVLLGRCGHTITPAVRMVNQIVRAGEDLILAPRGKHSAKPETMQERVERIYPDAAKLELFARRERPGWVCLGNEITGNDIREDLAQWAEIEL